MSTADPITFKDSDDGLELEEYVWKHILLKNINREYLTALKTIPLQLKKGRFQVFEVLVAEALSLLDHDIQWIVTAVQGDGGIDFEGVVVARDIPEWFVLPSQVILGQVKRRARGVNIKDIRDDLAKISNFYAQKKGSVLWAVIYIISTADFGKQFNYISKVSSEPWIRTIYGPNPPIVFLDGKRFLSLLSSNSRGILSLLDKSFSEAELNLFESYLDRLSLGSSEMFNFEIKGNNEGITGLPLQKKLIVTSKIKIPSSLKLQIRWEPDHGESNIVQIVNPDQLSSSEGIVVAFNGKEKHQIDIQIRCFCQGRVSLGTIYVLNEKRMVLSKVPLGSANFYYQFVPPFFRSPNERILFEAESIIKTSKTGMLVVMAITGVGGSGKSRLCEELLSIACKNNHQIFTISHANNKTSRGQLIRDIFFQLFNTENSDLTFIDDMIAELKSHIKGFDTAWEKSLRDYFENNISVPSIDIIVKALLSAFLVRTEKKPMALHLKDMHWGDKDDFLILKQLIHNIKANQKYFSNGILFVFEGRNREALKIDEDYYSPIDWFSFLKNDFIIEKTVAAWSKFNSEEFLSEIFDTSINRNAYTDPKALPLHQELIDNLLFWANGNPMHLIEQLKLLLSMNVIKQFDNGLLYVREKLPTNYAVPVTTRDMIKYRIEFYRNLYPECVEFIGFISRIERKIHGSLYTFLQKNLFEHNATDFTELLRGMGFATLPTETEYYFEFSHENYYQAFLNERLSKDSTYPRIALKWYEKIPNHSKKQILEQVLITGCVGEINYDEIAVLVKKGLELHSEDHIDEKLLKQLIQLPNNILDKYQYAVYTIYFEIAEILIRIGSWKEALYFLESVKQLKETNSYNRQFIGVFLQAKSEIANVRTDLQQPDIAIKEIDEALDYIQFLEKKDGLNYDVYKEDLWDKRCVALWFNGQITDAIKWQWKAYLTSKKRLDLRFSSVLRQMGTMYLHRDPGFGIHLLERSLVLANAVPTVHFQMLQIIECQLLMGYLLQQCIEPHRYNKIELSHLKERAVLVHHDCLERRSIYVASVCGLICGSITALLGEYDDAEYWFKMTISTAIEANLDDVLWKARLNLAQLYAAMGLDNYRSLFELNLLEAHGIITNSLDSLKGDYLKKRLRLMRLPLSHIYRLSGGKLKALDVIDVVDWRQRPYFLSKRGMEQQVLHVRDNDFDYFLMN